jgi:hypothetical protein
MEVKKYIPAAELFITTKGILVSLLSQFPADYFISFCICSNNY